jgi:hypothetical protein
MSDSPLETLLRNEAIRRNEMTHYFDMLGRCRALFAPRSATSSQTHALLVALDLLVGQRFCRIDVAPVAHQSIQACFLGWQRPDSPVEVFLPIAATAETQTPALFRSILRATSEVTGVPNQTTTLAIVSSDSTVVYYRCGLHLRGPADEALFATITTVDESADALADQLPNAEHDQDDAGEPPDVVGAGAADEAQ